MAGLPNAVRAAVRVGQELSADRIVIVGADDAFLRTWATQLSAAGVPTVGDQNGASALDESLPLLALDPESFPDKGGLTAFLSAVEDGDARRLLSGRPVAVLRRAPGVIGAGARAPKDVLAAALAESVPDVAAGAFFDTRDNGASSTAQTLYARLVKDTDGYIAHLDRSLSIALTRALLPFPITPNHVTTAGLMLGLLGAYWLSLPSAAMQFYGALVLWFCCLLDGCDGEIARLKHLSTPWGATYDVSADYVAHLATFVALPIGVARLHPEGAWMLPGVLLVTGFLSCGFSVWWLVLRLPDEKRGPLAVTIERIASRDYVYLIVILTSISRLDWFVWAAAIGSHVFNIWLWRQPPRAEPAVPTTDPTLS